jgi:hypothetical protein
MTVLQTPFGLVQAFFQYAYSPFSISEETKGAGKLFKFHQSRGHITWVIAVGLYYPEQPGQLLPKVNQLSAVGSQVLRSQFISVIRRLA